MKHAYLIIAHNEFKVLEQLLIALDDNRNDIYIHIDKKVKEIPLLITQHAKLMILDHRLDVRWGHYSQIECEYALFEEAYYSNNKYDRYHLISGTHLPLKNQDQMHAIFDSLANKEILRFMDTDVNEIDMKLRRYHFFLRNFKNKNKKIERFNQFLWHLLLKLQSIFNIKKQGFQVTIKANNWISLTHQAVLLILNNKATILQKMRWTFCADEFFIPLLLQKNSNNFEMINYPNLLFNEFENSNPRILTIADYNFLIHSDYLFARKFSEQDFEIVTRIVQLTKVN
jgi:hypothetical protein